MDTVGDKPIQWWLDRLAARLARHRLNRNLSQIELAEKAGVSPRTLSRLENGEATQFENFLRVLCALELESGLDILVPEVAQSPVQRLDRSGRVRERASGRRKKTGDESESWTWGDES